MGQIVCFFVAIFMFATMFVSSADSLTDKQQTRIAKQNLNLSGREIINNTYFENGKIKINEIDYLKKTEQLNGMGEIIGGVFYYNNCIVAVKNNLGSYEYKKVNTEKMTDTNKRNTINNLIDYLLPKNDSKIVINMSVENEEDCFTEAFFNKPINNTVFIIGKMGEKIFLSGFMLNIE